MNICNSNKRLPISLAISLLLHLLAFLFIHYYITHYNKSVAPKSVPLVVQLQHLEPPGAHSSNTKKLITVSVPSPLKISPIQQPATISADPPKPVISKITSTHPEKITGIAMPGKVATPFSGFQAEGNTFFQTRHSQQEIARTYYQQSIEAQARLKNEQQAHILVMQLQQMLRMRLEANPSVTGTCILVDTASNVAHLKCDSASLYEQIRKEERSVIGILNLLRNMGKNYKGFTAERPEGSLLISLSN